MMIYLTHPYHGAKHALSDQEAALDEKNGWTRGEQPKAVTCEVPSAPVIEQKAEGKQCQKCGKSFVRGLTMHERHCKG